MFSHLFCIALGVALLYAGQKYHFHRMWKRAMDEYRAGGTSSED